MTQIKINNTEFVPAVVEVPPGSIIKWIVTKSKEMNNKSEYFDNVRPHVIEIPLIYFESEYLQEGQSCSRVFDKEGVYDYVCGIVGCKGKVTVKRVQPTQEPTLHTNKNLGQNLVKFVESKQIEMINHIANLPEDEEKENTKDGKNNHKKRNKKKRKFAQKNITEIINGLYSHCSTHTILTDHQPVNINNILKYMSDQWDSK